jgi:hypothetical protein
MRNRVRYYLQIPSSGGLVRGNEDWSLCFALETLLVLVLRCWCQLQLENLQMYVLSNGNLQRPDHNIGI